MKALYFDCSMGAAGDMITAALLELLPDPEETAAQLRSIFAGKAEFRYSKVSKCGIQCGRAEVVIDGEIEGETPADEHAQEHHHHHAHTTLSEVREFIASLSVSQKAQEDSLKVFDIIAAAESRVHGCPIENIHFHEVGSIDAMVDVVSACYLLDLLKPEKIFASPIDVGNGFVHCAHGELSVPAPATQEILKGIPYHKGDIQAELCTPTGAALLKYFVDSFGEMPKMTVSNIGYGAGFKDFSRANAIRVLLGTVETESHDVIELACNLDDMTPEELGFAMEKLFEQGALDVYFTSIGMKKCRPGVMLTCMCREEQKEKILRCIFKHTTTIGVREYSCRRYVQERHMESMKTPYGEVKIKTSEGYGAVHSKIEFEDLKKIADENNLSLREARSMIDS